MSDIMHHIGSSLILDEEEEGEGETEGEREEGVGSLSPMPPPPPLQPRLSYLANMPVSISEPDLRKSITLPSIAGHRNESLPSLLDDEGSDTKGWKRGDGLLKERGRQLTQEWDLPIPEKEESVHGAARPSGSLARSLSLEDEASLKITNQLLRFQQERMAAVGATLITQSSVKREGKLLVAMVGMPARGKTFLANAMKRHLDWMGLKSELYNVADHRRQTVTTYLPPEAFFRPEGRQLVRRMTAEMLERAIEALRGDTDIAIIDASLVEAQSRSWVAKTMQASGVHAQLVFVESICNDQSVIESRLLEMKDTNPDFRDMDGAQVVKDFHSRMALYQQMYQPLETEEGVRFIKVIDDGRQIITNLISGYINGRLMSLLANLHTQARPILMSRHGESEYNMQGRIGGDSALTPAGKSYAEHLARFICKTYNVNELAVWTSTMVRTGMTVRPMLDAGFEVIKWRALDEINAGMMDGLTYAEVAEQMPNEYEARRCDKLKYRYPRGESYEDVFQRLEPVIFEMLRHRTPLLIVGHQAILRVLYGYLMHTPAEKCPTLSIPLHTVINLVPRAYGVQEEIFEPIAECGLVDNKEPTLNPCSNSHDM